MALGLAGALIAASGFAVLALHPGSSSVAMQAPKKQMRKRATGGAQRQRPEARRPVRHSTGEDAVPILMYHVIARAPASAAYPGLYVTPARFAAQMSALAHAGYRADTLDQVRNYWLHGTPLPAGKPIVVTFDNGYRTQYTKALPDLERFGWVADENMQLTGLPPAQGGLLRREVKALVRDGWELDTQGFSHADLITLDPAALRYQVAAARAVIRRRFHVSADWFCYPSGDYDAEVIAAVKSAGYVGSTTVSPGWATPRDDPFRLPRLRVLGSTTPEELLALISGTRADPPPPASYPDGSESRA